MSLPRSALCFLKQTSSYGPPRLRLRRNISSVPPLISIQNGTFYRQHLTPDTGLEGKTPPVFPNFSFFLPAAETENQTWAVIGGSYRVTLFDILRGNLICVPPVARSYPYLLTDEVSRKDPRLRFVGNAIRYIGFTNEYSKATNGTRGAYLSARYESRREEGDWTLGQFLRGQTLLNPPDEEIEVKIYDDGIFKEVISDMQLEDLLDMPIANLSNGQTRRAHIAKGLIDKPELLLIDGPLSGLDPSTGRTISRLLQQMVEKRALRLILGLRPQDKVPDWVTHIMVLGYEDEILLQDTKNKVDNMMNLWRRLLKSGATLETFQSDIQQMTGKSLKLNQQVISDLNLRPKRSSPTTEIYENIPLGEPLIEMKGVCVQYGDKPVLGNWVQQVNGQQCKGLHWTVRRGHRWAVLGANGSGKTTLLSLITSDHPQTYSQPVKLFGRSRLPEVGNPGLSLFDLQSRMGHSSPEIHALFPRQLSIRQAVESAFADSFFSKPRLDVERDLDVSAALAYFRSDLGASVPSANESETQSNESNLFPRLCRGVRGRSYNLIDDNVDYADDIRFGDLDAAQQRVVLFIRAIVHKPDLVILDEPFSGMSPILRDKCISFLEYGEMRHRTRTPAGRRSISGASSASDLAPVRFYGLTDNQALIVISHVKDEIPRCVRNFIRLPYNSDNEADALDFRIGTLLSPRSAMSDIRIWEGLWAPASEFSRYTQRKSDKGGKTSVSRHPDDEKILWEYLK